jgi:hypothetical protein
VTPNTSLALLVALASSVVVACGGPEPKTQDDANSGGVPANSLSETRLNEGDGAKKPDAKDEQATPGASASGQPGAPGAGEPTDPDPTKPLMTPLTTGGSDEGAKPGEPATGTKRGQPRKKGPVSKAECQAALDHGLDLLLTGDPRFAGIPPEMMAQFKQTAMAANKAQNPCTGKGISRAEYDCDMAATTADEFKRCDKIKK